MFLISAEAAAEVACQINAPLFIDCEESNIFSSVEQLTVFGKQKIEKFCTGFISNSPIISDYLNKVSFSKFQPKLVAPSWADPEKFYPRDIEVCRREKGFNESDFIIIFVGQFIERKGFNELLEALKLNPNVKAIFIGKGKAPSENSQIIFSGSVDHTELPGWLGCANTFVLPTKREGSSYAIAEAMTMGMPIISSDIPEVTCQVFTNSSILVDPNSIKDLASAIATMQQNYQQYKLSALNNVKSLPPEKRHETMLQWIKKLINEEKINR